MRRVSFWTVTALALVAPVHTIARGQDPLSVVRADAGNHAMVLSGTRADVFTVIQGTALNADNTVLADVPVRLRDARLGRIVNTTNTDEAGLFSFQTVDPGSYIVEVLGTDREVLAASQILNVDAGQTMTAVVKLPFRIRPYSGVLGHTTSSAAIVIATAAASGVLATQIAGQATSPPG